MCNSGILPNTDAQAVVKTPGTGKQKRKYTASFENICQTVHSCCSPRSFSHLESSSRSVFSNSFPPYNVFRQLRNSKHRIVKRNNKVLRLSEASAGSHQAIAMAYHWLIFQNHLYRFLSSKKNDITPHQNMVKLSCELKSNSRGEEL